MELYPIFTTFPSYYFVLFYSIVFCSFLYICNKFSRDLVVFVIIMLFYSGMFAYFGKFIENTYKILILCLTVYACLKWDIFKFNQKRLNRIVIFFIIFSTTFFISAIVSQNDVILVTSQYAKFLIPFCFFFIFRHYSVNNPLKFKRMNSLFLTLLSIQIMLSIAKLLIFGPLESIVGSISYVGGAVATVLPAIGFIFLWVIKKGIFQKKDWIFFVCLLFIGFMSYKRAIWFIMPVIIFLFMVYIPKKKLQVKYLFIVFLSPIIFYMGVRLNPDLNKENKIWGSFDYDYAINYTMNYSFGREAHSSRKPGQGRGGATLLLFTNLFKDNFYELNNLFGYGMDEIYTKDYDQFEKNKFGVSSKGTVAGVFQGYISTGFLGVLTFLLYALSLIFYLKNLRIRIVLIGFFCWEYFFYTGIIFRIQALTVLFFYCIIYINALNNERLELKKLNRSLNTN